jgi:hypothetical protein
MMKRLRFFANSSREEKMYTRGGSKVQEQGGMAISLPAEMSGLEGYAESQEQNALTAIIGNSFRLPTKS